MSARTEDKRSRISRAVPEHAPALLTYFARRIDPPYDAADLLAETLLILWKRANGLPADDDEIRPWMFGIARHVLLHHQRSTVRRKALADRLRSQMSLVERPGFSDSSTFDDHP